MNGPEHYQRAEQLEQLAVRQYESSVSDEPAPLWQLTIAQAQMHATLALAAATAQNDAETGKSSAACIAWGRTLGDIA